MIFFRQYKVRIAELESQVRELQSLLFHEREARHEAEKKVAASRYGETFSSFHIPGGKVYDGVAGGKLTPEEHRAGLCGRKIRRVN